ncbi:transcription factor bHLH [Quillaja saponaria]|uniref:Transcription factor bHLH n=1 Tax=Quillaja saponaria TaxID=32244 RepID=A0AAD7L652_QUISA|nr:transcription factor bHLH [Quillaja saponaria]
MGEAVTSSALKNTLKSLCCANAWSYGLFWRFDPQNSTLLTVEDGFYEEEVKEKVNIMLQQVHMIGEGIIGQAAFTGNHQWLFSDAQAGELNCTEAVGSGDIYKDDSELRHQFSSGIKTIAVISVKPRGVLQLGSTRKILEEKEFLDQTKRLFREMENMGGLNPFTSTPSSLDSQSYDLNALFDSLISDSSEELMGNGNLSTSLIDSCTSISNFHEGRITPFYGDSSFPSDQFTAASEAQVLLSDKSSSTQSVFLNSNSSMNNSSPKSAVYGTWNSEASFLTSSEQQGSEVRVQDSSDVYCSKVNVSTSSRHTVQNAQEYSTLTTLYSTGGLFDQEESFEDLGSAMDNQKSVHSSIMIEVDFPENVATLQGLSEELKPVDFSMDLSKLSFMDDLSEWFSPSPVNSIEEMLTTFDNDLSQSVGVNSTSFGLLGGDYPGDIPVKCLASSLHNSITMTCSSDEEVKPVIMHNSENDILDGIGLDLVCDQAGECWRDILMPVVSASPCTASECISELDTGPVVGPRRGLFSELDLEEVLNGISTSTSFMRSSFVDQLSTNKRRRTEASPVNSDLVDSASVACSGASANLMQPVSNFDKTKNLVCKDVLRKSQVGLWIDDSYSINNGKAVLAQSQKLEELAKGTRKRARPGESTRPRPKDRQQIQDRLKELRGIIPNAGKCSIDSLLDRTIKYMLFLQSVTKYADKLTYGNEPKLIDQADGVVLKDNSVSGSADTGGVTWAFEVGGQTMVCPIIVEDLNPPGQMLIEMLCEEQEFFLEIADIIRRFGLNILKGKMESRENKIWARFIVEANRHVTRLDVFWSLVQFLQKTNTSEIGSVTPNNAINIEIPTLDNYQKPGSLPPISMAERQLTD